MTEFLRDHLRDAPVMADRAPWTLPDQALTFDDARQIQPTLSASGNHWLDPSTQAAQGHRLDPVIYKNRFFIVEHRTSDGAESHTVNWAARAPGDTHITVQRFDDVLPTREAAHRLAEQAFRGVEASTSPALAAVPKATRDLTATQRQPRGAVQVGPAVVHGPGPQRRP